MANKKAIPAGYQFFVGRIETMFENPEFSDFVLNCGDKTWKIHKSIVACGSEVFKKAFTSDFKEGSEGAMDLPEDDPVVVHEMLRYLYTADYQEEHTAEHPCLTPLLLTIHIHTMADKYNIPGLTQLAEDKYYKRAAEEWKTEDFANSIEEMYATAPGSKKVLHECAVQSAVANAKNLFGNDFGKRFREVSSKTPEFNNEFAHVLVGAKAADMFRYRCNSCYEQWTARAPPKQRSSYPYYSGCLQCYHGYGGSSQFWTVLP